jgi:hypothetical protein
MDRTLVQQVISELLSRNKIEKIHGHESTILDVPDNTMPQ